MQAVFLKDHLFTVNSDTEHTGFQWLQRKYQVGNNKHKTYSRLPKTEITCTPHRFGTGHAVRAWGSSETLAEGWK